MSHERRPISTHEDFKEILDMWINKHAEEKQRCKVKLKDNRGENRLSCAEGTQRNRVSHLRSLNESVTKCRPKTTT